MYFKHNGVSLHKNPDFSKSVSSLFIKKKLKLF